MKALASPCAKSRGLALLLTALIAFTASAGPAESRDERAVRAAYVYNLIKYVEWPAPHKDLTLVFAGDDATGDVISHLLDGKSLNGQTIRAVRFSAAGDLRQCTVLYVADSREAELHRYLDAVRGKTILTVGETEAFTRAGGMVGLVNTGDHIRIDVNLEVAQAAGIRISSRVLDLATIVRPSGKGGN